jgi:hypothetical protein
VYAYEVQAAAQDRTMVEVTHCCGTLDYHKDPILKKTDDRWKHIGLNATELPELTCLTLAGMIKIFCKYLQEGIVPYEMNLGRDSLAPSGVRYDPVSSEWRPRRSTRGADSPRWTSPRIFAPSSPRRYSRTWRGGTDTPTTYRFPFCKVPKPARP